MTNDAASTTTVISEHDQRRIRAAMSAMPYAATERVPKPWVAMGDAVDADAVVAFLEGSRKSWARSPPRATSTGAACSPSRPTWRRSAASSAPRPPR